jgi:hypothetical protein
MLKGFVVKKNVKEREREGGMETNKGNRRKESASN